MSKYYVLAKYLFRTATAICMLTGANSTIADSDIGNQANILAERLTSIKKGNVMDASEKEVYIDLGRKQGIVPGISFEIIRQGDPLKRDGKIIGYKESKIALVKIDRARPDVSIGKILVKKETARAGDKAYEQRKPIKRLVIAQFSYNQAYNQFTKNLQEKLFAAFINRGMQVVERDQLEKVLAEQQIGYSGLINIDSAKKIGELLGAEAMLLGSVGDLGNSISLNARLVDLGTGDSITAGETDMPKTPAIVELINSPVEDKPFLTNIGGARGGSNKPGDKKKRNVYPKYENDEFRVEALSLRSEGKGQVLKLRITNLKDEAINIWIAYEKDTYLISDTGNQYKYKESELGNDTSFPPKTAKIVSIIFRGDIDKEEILSLAARTYNHGYITIENIIRQR